MAVSRGLPSNLYAGGAVRISSTPFTNYYLNTIARNRAQQDAMYRYFGDMGANLTQAGVHQNDVPALLEKKQAWQDYVMQHPKEYANPSLDKGQVYANAQALYNDAQNHILRSKDKVKNLLIADALQKDPTKAALLAPATLDHIHRASLPITDPNYAPLDPENISFNPKPFDLRDQASLNNILSKESLKPSQSVESITDDKSKGTRITKYKNSFNEDQNKEMESIGHTLYDEHPGYKKYIDDHSLVDDKNFQDKNALFKQRMGRDIENGYDMSAADIMARHPAREGKEVPGKIPETMEDKKALIAARGKQTQANMAYNQGLKDTSKAAAAAAVAPAGSKSRTYFDTLYADALKTKEGDVNITGSEGGNKFHKLELDQDALSRFHFKDPNTGKSVSPNEMYISGDMNKIKPVFYSDEANKVVNKNLSGKITKAGFEQTLGKHLFGLKEQNKAPVPGATETPKVVKPAKNPLDLKFE